jgi:hypothetical protein
VQSLKISKQGINRYRIHYGVHKVEGDWDTIGYYVHQMLDAAFVESDGDLVTFEAVSNIPSREFSNVVHELDCVLKSRTALVEAHKAGVSKLDLLEYYKNYETAVWVFDLARLQRVLGIQREEDEQKAS